MDARPFKSHRHYDIFVYFWREDDNYQANPGTMTDMMTMTMMTTTTAPSISAEELVDALNKGIISAIQTCGKSLPSSAIPISNSSPFQCEWSEYSTTHCSPAVEDMRKYFPPLKGNEVGSDGRPLLYAACLGLLLSERDKKDGLNTPLSTFLSVASFLLDELDVNPNQPTLTKGACLRPPLHLLARSCHSSAVRTLLARGANPHLKDKEGWTALMACCMPDIVLEGDAANNDRVVTLKLLLKGCNGDDDDENATNINVTNYFGYTALHYACEGLHFQLIQSLLEGGADATRRTIWGQTCIGIIRSQGHKSQENALICKAIVMSHLENTGAIKSIRSFLEEEKKAMVVMDLVDDVLIPAARRPESDDDGSGNIDAQDRRIVIALMQYLDIDAGMVYCNKQCEQWPLHQEHSNLYEHIHQRVMDLLPQTWLRVYRSSPTIEEREIITCTNYDLRTTAQITSKDGVRRIDPAKILSQSFCLFRERGHFAKQLELLHDLITIPMQRTFGFGIPSNAVLIKILEYAPRILEMGAGTGYWSYCLSRMGADVVAYDPYPTRQLAPNTQEEKNSNEFLSSQSYFSVQVGDASTVFCGSNYSDMLDRALLLVWPNNSDSEDNKQFATKGPILPTIWDSECLERYYALGGDTVIYVGEREAKIELMPDAKGADCGFCSSRKFQTFLQDHYKLEAELECPRWWMKEDDVTIWKRS